MPSGPHLAYWDSKDETLVNARGMQVGCLLKWLYNFFSAMLQTELTESER